MNQRISVRERRLLILFTSFVFCSLLVFFTLDILDDIKLYQLRAKYPNIAIDVVTVRLAGLNLFVPFIFIAILAAKKYVVSTVLTLIYGILAATGLYLRIDGTGSFGGEEFYTDITMEVWNKTHPFEYVAGLLLLRACSGKDLFFGVCSFRGVRSDDDDLVCLSTIKASQLS